MTTDRYTTHRNTALATVAAIEEFDLHGPTHLATIVAIAQVHATLALAAATHDQVLQLEDSAEFADGPVVYLPVSRYGLPQQIAIVANAPQTGRHVFRVVGHEHDDGVLATVDWTAGAERIDWVSGQTLILAGDTSVRGELLDGYYPADELTPEQHAQIVPTMITRTTRRTPLTIGEFWDTIRAWDALAKLELTQRETLR